MRLDTSPTRRTGARSGVPPQDTACLECGASLADRHARAEFCADPCRKAWNNRRMKRGAEIYDLFMAHRFDRTRAVKLKLLGHMNRMASNFREEDRDRRAGRRSWRDPGAVLRDRPWLFATVFYLGTGRKR